MRVVDEAAGPLRQPVIAPRLPALAVHALLHHRPMAVVGDDEAVQIETEAVLHRRRVHLGDQPAGTRQMSAMDADAFTNRREFLRRLARMLAAPPADMDA